MVGHYVLSSSNKHGGWNKRGEGAKVAKLINVEVGICIAAKVLSFCIQIAQILVEHVIFRAKL